MQPSAATAGPAPRPQGRQRWVCTLLLVGKGARAGDSCCRLSLAGWRVDVTPAWLLVVGSLPRKAEENGSTTGGCSM